MLIFPSQAISKAIDNRLIISSSPIPLENVQPASLDLRLSSKAWRVAASFLPASNQSVAEKINSVKMHECTLDDGFIFEKGCVYIVELAEELALTPHIRGRANPKSSTGRLDIFARVLTDGGDVFDDIPAGYHGKLYVEVAPKTFSIKVKTSDRLVQIRLMQSSSKESLTPNPINFTVDVIGGWHSPFTGDNFPAVVGWRARKHAGLVDLSLIKHYHVLDYWEPVFARQSGGIILDPDDFYILATNENIEIPENFAAEMIPYDTAFGEFRVHYAGFFDPGFGIGTHNKARGVLEVRTHEVPFLITENQVVGSLVFSALLETPDKIYGQKNIHSNYQGQGLCLAKQFAPL